MATLKSSVYIKLKKDSFGRIQVVGATGAKPGTVNGFIVVKIDVDIDESAFDPIFDTNSVIKIGGKPATPAAGGKKTIVQPENIVAGLQEIGQAMTKL